MIVGAVVLAAGKSERMGQNKLLLPLDGKKLIDNVLDALLEAGIEEQVVVVGHKPEEVLKAVKPRLSSVKVAVNRDYDLGMTSSFQVGLRLLMHVDAAFLVLGDEPILDPKFLRSLIEPMEKGEGKTLIVTPIHCGKKGASASFSQPTLCGNTWLERFPNHPRRSTQPHG